jgi:DNA-binding transcriptional MerR regulator
MKTGELAARLGVAENTIRNWAREYGAEFLSEQGRGYLVGATRTFDERDVLMMASISDLRSGGLTHAQVKESLRGGYRARRLPEAFSRPAGSAPDGAGSPDPSGEQVEQLRAEIVNREMAHQAEVKRLAEELARERQARKEAEERIRALEREAGVLQGQLQVLRQRGAPVFGGEEDASLPFGRT